MGRFFLGLKHILYHLGKANILVDILNKLFMVSTTHVEEGKKELTKKVHILSG